MNLWLTDPGTKEPSVTMTLFVYGFGVACLKMLSSGIVIEGIHLAQFGGGDFAAVVGALGTIYAARRHTDATVSAKVKDHEEK